MTSRTWQKTFYLAHVTVAVKISVLHKLSYPALAAIKTKAGNIEIRFYL